LLTLREILRAVYRKDFASLERFTRDEANATDDDGRTPLMHAILAEDADASVIKALIARGAVVNVADRGQQWTPLHFAARDANEEIVRALLDAGASVDAANVFGNTPLWEHVMGPKKDTSIIKKLLAGGADPDKKNSNGVSPIDLARMISREDLLAILEEKEKSGS
jgi:uncharacterized protein